MGVSSEGGVADGPQSPPRPATFHTVQLVIDPGGRGSIMVDGVDFSPAVNGMEIETKVGHTTQITLFLVESRVEFDGQVTVGIPDRTRDALIALGWTPPAGVRGMWFNH